MIQTIYAEVPREKIEHLTRAEFINGDEQSFHDTLKASMAKYGFRDPVYCWYHSKPYKDKIHIIVGNNRMTVAKELGIKKVKAIITDGGGITCHAAIISRELKKPCIIGTKIELLKYCVMGSWWKWMGTKE